MLARIVRYFRDAGVFCPHQHCVGIIPFSNEMQVTCHPAISLLNGVAVGRREISDIPEYHRVPHPTAIDWVVELSAPPPPAQYYCIYWVATSYLAILRKRKDIVGSNSCLCVIIYSSTPDRILPGRVSVPVLLLCILLYTVLSTYYP